MQVRSSLLVMSTAAFAVAAQVFATVPAEPAAGAGAVGRVAAPSSRSWEPTVVLADYNRGSSFVVDAHNNTTIVWEAVEGEVMSVRRSAGGAWSAPEVIGQSNAGFGSPRVAADAEGNVTAVWMTQRSGRTDGVKAATRPAGGGWSHAHLISDDRRVPTYPGDGKGPWGATDVALAVSPKGAVAVAWAWGSEDRTKPWRIQSVYRRSGRGWSDVVDVTQAKGNRDPQVGISADGTVVLLYARQPFGHPQALLSRRRHVGAGWTDATTVAREGYAQTLAVDRAGDAVVVFTPHFGRVMAAYRHAGGRWGTPQRLSPEGARTNDHFALAMNGQGKAVVAMGRRHGRVDLVQRPPHGSWSAPVSVVDASDSSEMVTVALNGSGDAFLGWGLYAVTGVYRSAGGTWSREFTISPETAVDVLDRIHAEVAPNGDVVVMWEQEDLPMQVRVMTTS
jgi:hypothetical protein